MTVALIEQTYLKHRALFSLSLLSHKDRLHTATHRTHLIKPLPPNPINLSKLAHIDNVDPSLYHLVEARARRFETGFDVLDGLFLDGCRSSVIRYLVRPLVPLHCLLRWAGR